MTGGSGTLGRELRPLLSAHGHEVHAPSHAEMDVLDPDAVMRATRATGPDLVLHAAAWTDVAGAERERHACWALNVEGTRHVRDAARSVDAPLVHLSTDYVFWGEEGGYAEDDPPGPVRNYYALTKLVAEEAARAHPRTLVLRTSFRPRDWPHPVAFEDLFTSQAYVDELAPELALAVTHAPEVPWGTLHVAGPRTSAYQLARRRTPEVRPGRRADANVALPADISLDTRRWRDWKREKRLGAEE